MAIKHNGSRIKTYRASPETNNCEMLLEQSPPNENALEINQRFHIIIVENALSKEYQQLIFIFLGSIFFFSVGVRF